jgi:putative ABC transport system permease protein
LGFSSAQVTGMVLAESLLITLIGGALGMLLGGMFAKGIGEQTKQFLPMMHVPPSAYVLGAACMAVLGLLSGALPCWQAWQLKITDALRRG